MRFIVLVLASLLAACGAPPEGHPGVIEITETEPGRWQAVYRFPAPVTTLHFARPAQFHRESSWRIMTPGYALARAGDSQVIALESGAAASASIVVEFPEDAGPMTGEYHPFERFSDGGVAVYTGHLYAAADIAGPPLTRVRIDPGPERGLVVDGSTHHGPVLREGRNLRGTYAYIGNAVPERTPHLVLVADPGLPDWLGRAAVHYLPRFFEYYAARTGHALQAIPTVLFSFVPDDSPGYAMHGGFLPDLILVSVRGDDWSVEDAYAAQHLLHFLAHEAAHLWNAQLADIRSGDSPWIHEGGADAFAQRALLALGLIDRRGYAEYTESASERCRDGDLRHYACGFLLAQSTEAALESADTALDLFSFWGKLISRAQEGDGRYDEAMYFALLGELGVDDETVAAMRQNPD